MWQCVSTSSQRVAHSFSIGLEVVQSGFTMKLKEKGLRHTHIHHACHSTNGHDCTRRYISTCVYIYIHIYVIYIYIYVLYINICYIYMIYIYDIYMMIYDMIYDIYRYMIYIYICIL